MADPIEVVQAFCDAMSKRNAEALRDFLAAPTIESIVRYQAAAGRQVPERQACA